MRQHLRVILAAVALAMALSASAVMAQDGAPPPGKPAGGPADFKTVTVTGNGEDADRALRDAQRKAVEEAAGTTIFSDTKTQNFQLIKDTVIARAAGFIQSYDKISERKTDDDMVELKMKAVVSISKIGDTWGVVKNLLQQMGRPKIMVWIDEKIGNEVVPDSTVQAKVEEILLKSGFILIDRDRVKQLMEREKGLANIEDKPEKLIALLKQDGAQIFITGTANATQGDRRGDGDMTIFTYEAECNLRCYNADTGQLVSKIPGRPTRGVQRVWRSAAKQSLDFQGQIIAPAVQADILQHWMDWLGGLGELKLEVEGITFGQLTKLKKALKGVKSIKDFTAEFHSGVATCSIQSESKAQALAEDISNAVNSLEVTDVTANTIKAKYTGKE